MGRGVPAPQGPARFERRLVDESWRWSEELFLLHGYRPGEVELTTELLLRHKHPEDLEHARALFARLRRRGGSFSNLHRVIGADDRERRILTVGAAEPSGGTADVVRGYMVDLTQPVRAAQTAAVEASAANRAAIEQAKGVLMATFGLGQERAMAFLRRWSMDHNVRVAEVADALVAAFEDAGSGGKVDVLDTLGRLTGRGEPGSTTLP